MSSVDYYLGKEFNSLSGKTAIEMMDEYTLKIAEILKEIIPEARGFRITHVFDEKGNSRTKFNVVEKKSSLEIMKEIKKEENC